MESSYQEFRVFLSSPGDVAEERRLAKSVIDEVGRICKEHLRLHLHTLRWEDVSPTAFTEVTIQEQINELVRSCHVFVLILNKRFGTVETGFSQSNTEREIDAALALTEVNRKINFLAYLHDLEDNSDQGEQECKVRDLRKRLADKGILYSEYKSPSDFERQFTHHLYDTVLKFRHSTTKVKSLSRFWLLGTPERFTERQIVVIYPTLSFTHMRPVDPSVFWLRRILPTVQYEDMRTVDKVDKTLRLIGVRDTGFYAADNPPNDIMFMNRVWICQARNKLGQKYFDKHKEKAKFFFRLATGDKEAKLFWRYNLDSDDYIEIKSPLNKYLEEQRKTMAIDGAWRREMGLIVAKDYGVLARLRNDEHEVPMRYGFLYDYFIAGIRGLGTWGVAQFLDRNYHIFMKYSENLDIQILVEVTYKDGRIFDVRDVSGEPEHYFKKQNSRTFIRSVIQDDKV